jgi:hypothetical protein
MRGRGGYHNNPNFVIFQISSIIGNHVRVLAPFQDINFLFELHLYFFVGLVNNLDGHFEARISNFGPEDCARSSWRVRRREEGEKREEREIRVGRWDSKFLG